MELRRDPVGGRAVVRSVETGDALVECFDRRANHCVIAPACRLHDALGAAHEAFFKVLDSYTLADITPLAKILRFDRLTKAG